MGTDEGDGLAVCLYSGSDSSGGAISRSLRLKLRVLGELADEGFPVSARAFLPDGDGSDERVLTAPTALSAIGHRAFGLANLYVFEFGGAYDVFDLIFLASRRAPTVAVYHGVPAVDARSEGDRAVVERSLRQRYNLFAAHHVACESERGRQELLDLGLPADRLSVLPIPGGERPDGAWRATDHDHVDPHSYLAFRRRFVGLVALLLRDGGRPPPPWLSQLEALGERAGSDGAAPVTRP